MSGFSSIGGDTYFQVIIILSLQQFIYMYTYNLCKTNYPLNFLFLSTDYRGILGGTAKM